MSLIHDSLEAEKPNNEKEPLEIIAGRWVDVRPHSVRRIDGATVFVANHTNRKNLYVVWTDSGEGVAAGFSGERIGDTEDGEHVLLCPMDHHNAKAVREIFDFTRPKLIGTDNSFGFGDRLGLANPAHLRAVRGTGFEAVLAQQSIRELERTERTPDEVMDVATWAVLQEGFTGGFGSDADHLKTTEHIDSMAAAGYTMYTIDPGDHVVNEADHLPAAELAARAEELPWGGLEDTLAGVLSRYSDRPVTLPGDLVLEPSREQVLRALVKYGSPIAHTATMFRHLENTLPASAFELEVSVDETESVTSPFEHLLFASELRRLGVRWVGLAPRFVGHFEKGIDFRGDLDLFRQEYLKHLAIAEAFGGYKISIHSGSDKFSVYRVIGDLGRGRVHVKTAGTSYLEALRTLAEEEPNLFREILDFSRGLYEVERRTYHVSAQLDRVAAGHTLGNDELPSVLDSDDARQVLHVTFGRVLTERAPTGNLLYKDRLMDCLRRHESTHDRFIETHFQRHLRPFEGAGKGAER